ncbi:MAG: AbrB/MazE/SpoVT family DNA-binding domain-containing protein [Candidatus Methanoperedenaceae archaeon]|nr:AbrB/MazE/SpoVT family DNA-binding domain-containing protein [Candidatus Methanoperedenaceae archaeon]
MLTRKVLKMKNSRLITLPADLCNLFGINVGDRLQIDIEGKKIVITPTQPAKTAVGAASTQPNQRVIPT